MWLEDSVELGRLMSGLGPENRGFFAFRKMLGCGVCKYYGSPMWRSFDALAVHYFTQLFSCSSGSWNG